MTAALEGGEWSAARPDRNLPPGKTRYPLYRRLGGPQGRYGRVENLVPTGTRFQTVQPVAQSLYRLSYRAHIINLYYIIILWDHRRICGLSLTETSLCGAYLYIYIYIYASDLARARDFLNSKTPSPHLGPTQPPVPSVSPTFSVEVKRPGREVEHSPPVGAKINNGRSSTSAPRV
jgi:hypothetical protein